MGSSPGRPRMGLPRVVGFTAAVLLCATLSTLVLSGQKEHARPTILLDASLVQAERKTSALITKGQLDISNALQKAKGLITEAKDSGMQRLSAMASHAAEGQLKQVISNAALENRMIERNAKFALERANAQIKETTDQAAAINRASAQEVEKAKEQAANLLAKAQNQAQTIKKAFSSAS